MLYALSTCVWCKKTKKLLTELGVDFSYVYVDLLKGEEQARVIAEVSHLQGEKGPVRAILVA